MVDAGVAWKELGPTPSLKKRDDPRKIDPKVTLGRTLFFDPRISNTREMACASCHDPDLGWADGRTVSFGIGRTSLPRNSPSLLNAAFTEIFFWDGRANSLEDQARQVLTNEREMGSSEVLLKERLQSIKGYPELFEKAYGDPAISLNRVASALATFERTIVGGRNQFDAFLKGRKDALSDEAIVGLDLFRREGRCLNCHHGPLLTDGQMHDIGLSYFGRKLQDLGRYTVTKKPEDSGKFRTPSLRNVTRTRPYMHNGIFDLEGVLNLYNAGMPTLVRKEHQKDDPTFPNKSPLLKSLGLNRQDLPDIIAFLESLEEPRFRMRPPPLPGIDAPAAPADSANVDTAASP